MLYRGQIDLSAEILQSFPIRDDLAVNPRASHAAIGKNLESQMSPRFGVADFKWILRVTIEIRLS